jgi:hypothetical protein
MGRFAAYLAMAIGGLAFWVMELLLNYKDYISNDPFGLEEQYQQAFIVDKTHLIFAELLFPFGMALAFLLILVFKLVARPVRFIMGFVLFLGMEFWMWRSFFFEGRIAVLYLRNQENDPTLQLPDTFREYLIGFAVAFALVLVLKEYVTETDPAVLDEKLRRSLKQWKE